MIELVDVEHDDVRLLRLLQLYIHEWTTCLPALALPGGDALFAYPDLEAWRDKERHRALLFLDERARVPIGFALTQVDDGGVAHVEEFFVLAGVRRRGLGARAAHALFAGAASWTLTVRPENPRALSFWRSVTSTTRDRRETVEVGDDGIARTRISFSR